MTQKGKFLIGLCVALAGTVSVSAIAISAQTDDKKKSVDYALQYSRYLLEEANASVTYDGKTVRTVNGAVTFKDEGVYKVEYSDEIVTVNVYREAPESTYEFSYELGEVVTGLSYELPTVQITDFLGKKVGKYSVNVVYGEEVLYTAQPAESYTFAQEGEYTLVYEYKNVFGTTSSKEVEVTSAHKRVIVAPDFTKEFNTSSVIDLTEIYGFYQGNKYPATLKIDGKTITESTYRFEKDGKYSVTLVSEVDGETLLESYKVSVSVDTSKLFSTNNCLYVSDTIGVAPREVTTYRSNEGVEIYTNTAGSSATFNGIIDLNTLSNTDNLVEFHTFSNAKANMDFCYIYLTDIYDENNWICVQMTNCWDGGGVDKLRGNHSYLNVLTSTGYFQKNAGVNHAATFYLKNRPTTGMFNFQIDYKTRTLYYYSGYGDHQKLIDLDDPTVMGSEKVWNGFTTGEVYMRLEFPAVSGNESGVIVTQVAGKNAKDLFAQTELFNSLKVNTDLDYLFEGMPKGVVDIAYPIPELLQTKNGNESFLTVLDSNGESVTVADGSFTPTQTGTYTIVYESFDVFGRKISKELSVEVVATHSAISATVKKEYQPSVGTYWQPPQLQAEGGHGKLQTNTQILVNGEACALDVAGKMYIAEPCQIEVLLTVYDYLGVEKEFVYNYDVTHEGAYLQVQGIPEYLIVGQSVAVPRFEAYNFALAKGETGYEMTKKIYINDVAYESGATYTVGDVSSVTFRFVADEGKPTQAERSFTVNVNKVATTGDMSGYFDANGATVTINSTYQQFAFGSDTTVAFKNPLVADSLNLQFGFENGKTNFEYFELVLTDYYDGKTVSFAVRPYDNKNSQFTTNEGNAVIPGSFEGTKYDFYYNNQSRALQSALGVPYMKITRTAEGNVFEGFEDRLVTVKWIFHGVTGETSLKVFTIGNQAFNTYGYIRGDRKGPMLSFGVESDNYEEIKLNDTYVIPSCFAYDVLQGKSEVQVQLLSPSGNAVYKNTPFTEGMSFQANEYGYWTLSYIGVDSLGNKQKQDVKIYVVDEVPPEVIVNTENFKTAYAVGEEITVPEATFSDNQKGFVAKIYVLTPGGRYVFLNAGETFTAERTGTHTLVYYVRDVDNNVTRKTVAFTVV